MTQLFLTISFLLLSGCQIQQEHHGFLVDRQDPKALQNFKVGVSTKTDIWNKMGPATCEIQKDWYYINFKKMQCPFWKPQIQDVQGYLFVWDDHGQLKQIIGAKRTGDFAFDPEETPLPAVQGNGLFKGVFQNTSPIPNLNVLA